MKDNEIINELKDIRNEMADIKRMLNIFIGDKAIGRSNSPGITDKIINYLECIAENTSKISRDR